MVRMESKKRGWSVAERQAQAEAETSSGSAEGMQLPGPNCGCSRRQGKSGQAEHPLDGEHDALCLHFPRAPGSMLSARAWGTGVAVWGHHGWPRGQWLAVTEGLHLEGESWRLAISATLLAFKTNSCY